MLKLKAMAKYKTKFDLEENGSYPDTRGVINIIGQQPSNPPYLSVSFHGLSGQIVHGWVADKDLERLAVNILRAIGSKKLKLK